MANRIIAHTAPNGAKFTIRRTKQQTFAPYMGKGTGSQMTELNSLGVAEHFCSCIADASIEYRMKQGGGGGWVYKEDGRSFTEPRRERVSRNRAI